MIGMWLESGSVSQYGGRQHAVMLLKKNKKTPLNNNPVLICKMKTIRSVWTINLN